MQWASPVTPAPTENDVRLAEIAASLVAAGGVEKRQTDAIRRLAGQLEKSERKIRELEERSAQERADEQEERSRERDVLDEAERIRKRDKQRKSDRPRSKERVHEKGTSVKPRRMSYGDARRAIEFTPRTPRRSSGGREVGEEFRMSGRRKEKEAPHSKDLAELETLRKEKAKWVKAKERSEMEASRLSTMFTGIKNNTTRLLEERDAHLKVIARLQDRLIEQEERAVEKGHQQKGSSHVHFLDDGMEYSVPLYKQQRSSYDMNRANNVVKRHERRTVSFDDGNDDTGSNFDEDHSLHEEVHASTIRSSREVELQEELNLVLAENARLSEVISSSKARSNTFESPPARPTNPFERSDCICPNNPFEKEHVRSSFTERRPHSLEMYDEADECIGLQFVQGRFCPERDTSFPSLERAGCRKSSISGEVGQVPFNSARIGSGGNTVLESSQQVLRENSFSAEGVKSAVVPESTARGGGILTLDVQESYQGSMKRGEEEKKEVETNAQHDWCRSEISELLQEVDILEGVADAIRFEVNPSEAEDLQETLTQVELNSTVDGGDAGDENEEHCALETPQEALTQTVKRLARIRADLALKYGRWLEAVGNDLRSTREFSVPDVNTADDTVSSLNTNVINKLIE